jgi:ABC-type hemin transport system ATPase subunit
MDRLNSIRFKNYKIFKSFSLTVKEFNVLVGPNNSGKSTILGAIRLPPCPRLLCLLANVNTKTGHTGSLSAWLNFLALRMSCMQQVRDQKLACKFGLQPLCKKSLPFQEIVDAT